MLETIKKYVGIAAAIALLVMGKVSYVQYKDAKELRVELSISRSNEKAFIAENDILKRENLAFKFNIDQLNYFNDSLITKMNEVRKELNIKDRDLKQMQFILSTATKTDTISLKDTIFIDTTLKIDTLIGDRWYNLKLGLQYPNIITASPTFISEKYIIVGSKKETIDPPKKWAIARWFQRKQRVVEVNIVEKNPYIKNNQQRFIEIIE